MLWNSHTSSIRIRINFEIFYELNLNTKQQNGNSFIFRTEGSNQFLLEFIRVDISLICLNCVSIGFKLPPRPSHPTSNTAIGPCMYAIYVVEYGRPIRLQRTQRRRHWVQIGTVFRCCIPCRGGSKAPATSSPDSETSPCDPLYPCETIVQDGHHNTQTILSNSKQLGRYDGGERNVDIPDEDDDTSDQQYLHDQIQALHYSIQHQQQSLLPHIEEEEESSQLSPEDEVCAHIFLIIYSKHCRFVVVFWMATRMLRNMHFGSLFNVSLWIFCIFEFEWFHFWFFSIGADYCDQSFFFENSGFGQLERTFINNHASFNSNCKPTRATPTPTAQSAENCSPPK